MIDALMAMGSVFLDPYLIFLIFITTILGVILGVLPGLGATTGAALLLPFTLTMDPVHAITVLATIYVSATFAGSITAILINTLNFVMTTTTFDGYPSPKRGSGASSWHSSYFKHDRRYFFGGRTCIALCYTSCL